MKKLSTVMEVRETISSTHNKKGMLSLDGGGVKGYAIIKVLAQVEKATQKPVYELFPAGVIGTSIGGIIGGLLTIPKEGGNIPHSASELEDIFQNIAEDIFQKSCCRMLANLLCCSGPAKYDEKTLEKHLSKYFQKLKMEDALVPLIVTTVENENSEIILLGSHNKFKDWSMATAMRATSAAPTYFTPETINGKTLIDGGLAANNPSGPGTRGIINTTNIDRDSLEVFYINLEDKTSFNESNTIPGFGITVMKRMFAAAEHLSSKESANIVGQEDFHEFVINIETPIDLDDSSPETFDQLALYAKKSWYDPNNKDFIETLIGNTQQYEQVTQSFSQALGAHNDDSYHPYYGPYYD